jgi:Ran GTPase-activating protein (RanGAP) involved in mRNA processing and transport
MTSGSQKELLSITKLLTSNYNITEINFRNALIKKPRIQELITAVTHNRTLRLLNLSSNQLGSETMVYFEDLLQKNTTLESLILQQNEITNTGVFPLADALANNTSLLLLDLSDNGITGPAIKALSASIQANSVLETLQLRKNELGIDGYRCIGDILAWSPTLHEGMDHFFIISILCFLLQPLPRSHLSPLHHISQWISETRCPLTSLRRFQFRWCSLKL